MTASSAGAMARLRAARPGLSETERRVADWILGRPDGLLTSSMMDVARACDVSDTTVLRMCRNCAFTGFTDLKLALAQDLATPTQLIHDEVEPNDPPTVVARKVIAGTISSLQDTLAMLDVDAFNSALALLSGAQRVLVGGVGASGVVAQSFYQRCSRLGLICDAPMDSHLQVMHAALLRRGDLAVGISSSGATKDVARMLSEAKAAGAATIAITGNADSPIARMADVSLLSVSHETRSEPLSARACQMALLDSLYVAYSLKHLSKALDNERRLNHAIAEQSF